MHRIAALAFAVLFAAQPAVSQEAYPSKPITLIVPYAAGGGSDFLGRVLAEGVKPWRRGNGGDSVLAALASTALSTAEILWRNASPVSGEPQ